jgi:diadenosine tetraphosphate (Ap4A) HIT family hydrolase
VPCERIVRPGCVFCDIVRGTHRASVVWEDHQGLSVWHSIGEAAFQEVPHLHIHVHPRLLGGGLLQVYPSAPPTPDEATRERYAATLRSCLG